MKRYFFMNKPEIVESDESGKPKYPAQFYYNRNQRQSYLDDLPYAPLQFKQKKPVANKKRRRLLYLLDILLLGIVGFYFWNYYLAGNIELQSSTSIKVPDSITPDQSFLEHNHWRYELQKIQSNPKNKEWQLILTNRFSDSRFLDREYKLLFAITVAGELRKAAPEIIRVRRMFQPGESMALASLKLSDEFRTIEKIKVQFDNQWLIIYN